MALGLMTCRVTCVLRRAWDPTSMLPGTVPPGLQRPVREAGHLPSCSDEIKNGSGYRMPPLCHVTSWQWHVQDKLRFLLLLNVMKANRWYWPAYSGKHKLKILVGNPQEDFFWKVLTQIIGYY